jgi:omega-amidase
MPFCDMSEAKGMGITMKISIFQMDLFPGDPEQNRRKAAEWARLTVKEEQPDTLVLPEMWTTAYTLPSLKTIADVNDEPTGTFLSSLATELNVNIIGGSFATMEDQNMFNRAVVFNRSGERVYHYDKIHLVPMLEEHRYLTAGKQKADVFELDGIKMGLIICYDLRFPELARSLALSGAQIMFVVAEWPAARKNHWQHLQIARAIENQMYVISANRVGDYDGVDFCGNSMVINAWGDIMARGTENMEETISADIDINTVHQARRLVPVFDSRVPHLYHCERENPWL